MTLALAQDAIRVELQNAAREIARIKTALATQVFGTPAYAAVLQQQLVKLYTATASQDVFARASIAASSEQRLVEYIGALSRQIIARVTVGVSDNDPYERAQLAAKGLAHAALARVLGSAE